MANGKNNLVLTWLICIGVLAVLGLSIWILIKQEDCCKKEKFGSGYRGYQSNYTADGCSGGNCPSPNCQQGDGYCFCMKSCPGISQPMSFDCSSAMGGQVTPCPSGQPSPYQFPSNEGYAEYSGGFSGTNSAGFNRRGGRCGYQRGN